MRLACAGVPETWVALCFQAGVRSKGQDHQNGGATLKIQTYDGLEKASCGVEAKRASLQGFESPSPHHFTRDIDDSLTSVFVKRHTKNRKNAKLGNKS